MLGGGGSGGGSNEAAHIPEADGSESSQPKDTHTPKHLYRSLLSLRLLLLPIYGAPSVLLTCRGD